MYGLYKKKGMKDEELFEFEEEVSLYGCKSGYIPWLLSKKLDGASEPHQWTVDVRRDLAKWDYPGRTLVINLKPNSKTPNLSLYEVVRAWGWSDCGWTPTMLHLRGLFIDCDPKDIDVRQFVRRVSDIVSPIFTISYLNGTVNDGRLVGRWTPPPRSPTNGALLWPETLQWFAKVADAVERPTKPSKS